MKKTPKQEREIKILLSLVDFYIKTGRPVGSQVLKEAGFEDLSSATIRNYFTKLEASGFLKQQHASGGRVPTDSAFRLYAMQSLDGSPLAKKEEGAIKVRLNGSSREVAKLLADAAQTLSEFTGCASFISSPRFDQDVLRTIKVVEIDADRCVCLMVSDFGLIRTEILHTPSKLSSFTIKRIESYFDYRLTGLDRPELSEEEEALGAEFYNEIMLRHISSYTHFSAEDLYKTGFSKLLSFPEFQEAGALANSLALFENKEGMRQLLRETCALGELRFWIGEDLGYPSLASVVAIPYYIHNQPVGAIAVLGSTRVDYGRLFELMRLISKCLSDSLTNSLFKHKITYRQPQILVEHKRRSLK